MRPASGAVLGMAAALLLPALASAQEAGDAARGRALAQTNCSTCHAVGRTGASPYRLAPTFRSLRQKYNVEALAEALAEGIVVGNTGERQMPRFVLSVDQIDDLIAYLKTLPVASRRAARF
jgi:cytochrome c